jgi:hypothetical protein
MSALAIAAHAGWEVATDKRVIILAAVMAIVAGIVTLMILRSGGTMPQAGTHHIESTNHVLAAKFRSLGTFHFE